MKSSKSSRSDFYLKKNTQSSVVVAASCRSSANLESILTTFSCVFDDGTKIRGLKDYGSQNNLISERVLNTNNHEVNESKVELTVSSINETKKYDSKLVRIRLLFGSECR